MTDEPALRVPSWIRSSEPESRIPVLIAIIAVITLQWAIPERYTAVPRWPLIVLEVLLLVVMVLVNPLRATRLTKVGLTAWLGLTTALTIDNTTSAAVLNYRILSGQVISFTGGIEPRAANS